MYNEIIYKHTYLRRKSFRYFFKKNRRKSYRMKYFFKPHIKILWFKKKKRKKKFF